MKELEDYQWFPNWLRHYQITFIGYISVKMLLFKPLINIINNLPPIANWVDLCSGSGLPASYNYQKTAINVPITYTDKFPINKKVTNLDVLNHTYMPNTLYTMYNSWHHFNNKEQKAIVTNISNKKAPFIIIELLQPNIIYILKVFFAATVGQLIFAPFVTPFSIKRLFFTYIIPLNLVTVLIDGIISVIKANSTKQMMQFALENSSALYSIKYITLPCNYFNKIYILKGEALA